MGAGTDTVERVRWRTWVDAAGVLLAAWLFGQVFRYRLVDLVQTALWELAAVVPAVPRPGTARLTALVSLGLWLCLPVVFGLLVVGVAGSAPEPTAESDD